MGSGHEIVDGKNNDFRVYGLVGDYAVAVGNTPFYDSFIPIGTSFTGEQTFDLAGAGLTTARYVRITAAPNAKIDAVKAINIFADAIRTDIGPAADAGEATITMRREKAPETDFDPFLELIPPDGSRWGENDSDFGDRLSLNQSNAAFIGMELTQVGFYRCLARGYHHVPTNESFGSFWLRLETGGQYDKELIDISEKDEKTITIPQKKDSITKIRQRDSFLFQATPGQDVNIVVNAIDSTLNPLLELYDPDDLLIAANDDYRGRGRNCVISLTLPDTSIWGDAFPNQSTYRLVISAVDTYTLRDSVRYEDKGMTVFPRKVSGGDYEKVFTGNLAEGEVKVPQISSVNPRKTIQGVNDLKLTISGNNFASGAKVSFSKSGINVKSVNVADSTTIIAIIDVSATADIGGRDVFVQNPDGPTGKGQGLFMVAETLGAVHLDWDPPTLNESLNPPTNLTATLDVNGLAQNKTFYKERNSNNTGIKTSPIIEIEPNNSMDDAQVLIGAQLIMVQGDAEVDDMGTIDLMGDDIEDLYKVEIKEPGLSVILDSFTSDCNLYIFNETSDFISFSVETGATGSELFGDYGLPMGEYFIGVSIFDPDPVGGPATAYMLTIIGEFEGEVQNPSLLSYNIYRSLLANARELGQLVGNVDASQNSYNDPAQSVNEYFYQVTAVYDKGESEPSNEAKVTVTRIDENNYANPGDFTLYQNHPNPFNMTTFIRFDLPRSTYVKIDVFNMLGQKIRSLMNEQKQSGSYNVSWNGINDSGEFAGSGIFIYRIQADGFTASKKLLLLK